MSKGHNFAYFIHEGVSNMFTHGFMSFAAVGVTVACLLIMGTFTLVAYNINEQLHRLEQDNQILAFVDDNLGDLEARALIDDIEGIPNVRSVEFISREQALDAYISQYGEEERDIFDGMEASVLRHRFAVHVTEISLLGETADAIRDVAGIARVKENEAVARGFVAMRNVASAVCIALIAVLFLVSIFIISNTIRLTTFDRRDEIAIMKMVGATNGFIRWPFVYEGFLLGTLGSLIAFLLQWLLYEFVVRGVSASDTMQLIQMVPFTQIWHYVAVIFALSGIVIGVFGSLTAIRKFLRV